MLGRREYAAGTVLYKLDKKPSLSPGIPWPSPKPHNSFTCTSTTPPKGEPSTPAMEAPTTRLVRGAAALQLLLVARSAGAICVDDLWIRDSTTHRAVRHY